MPSANPHAQEIINIIAEFEASVAAAEPALAARDWTAVDQLLADQRRLTHALANALEVTRDERPANFSEQVDRRIAKIREQRDEQMRRLVAFNHAVNARLAIISRSREMRRGSSEVTPPARILDTLQ